MKRNDHWKSKAEDLLNQMTLEEKMSQMKFDAPAIERLGIKSFCWWNEGLHGVARAGVATVFPQSIAMAATFDEHLVFDMAEAIAEEARAKFNAAQKQEDHTIYKGISIWSPNINIFRDPRWGRGHETYGEDPYLTGRLGVGYITGLQGDDPVYLKASACAKHYVAHSGPEAGRASFNSVVSKKDLYETYLPAFKAAVQEAEVESIMGAYNAVNDEPCCGSQTMNTDVLRNELGFEGYYVSDCGAINNIHNEHKITNSAPESAAMAVKAGCDLNCGSAYVSLNAAYNDGLITEADIDKCVLRLLMTRLKLGTINSETPWDSIPYSANDSAEHHALSLKAAERSLVLLKNNGILPVDKSKISSIAVIGPNADSILPLLGNYNGTPSIHKTMLDGIRDAVPKSVRINYSEGCHLYKDRIEGCADADDRISEAVTVALNSDLVILCVGLDATLEGEAGDAFNADMSGDKADLKLPQSQRNLIDALKKTKKPTIVVNISGSAIDLDFCKDFDGLIQCFYPGQFGGTAVGGLIFGEYSPSGKLPLTFYNSVDDLPDFSDYSMQNRTYRYTNAKQQYPFGFGLSYTNFSYSDLKLSADSVEAGDGIICTTTVKNTEDLDSMETVQLYLKDDEASVAIPRYQLKRIKPVFIKAGESVDISFTITSDDMSLIDNEGKTVLEPGMFTLYIGSSQPDELSSRLGAPETVSAKFTVR